MSVPGIVTLLLLAAIDSVQPDPGIAFHVKPLKLNLLNNEFCQYGLRKRPPHKWCICWGRIDGTRIEAMPWDCLTRSPKFHSRKKRDKYPEWKLEDVQNTRKILFPKDLLGGDVRAKPHERHDGKQPNAAWLGKVFSTLYKEMNSNENKLLADARDLSLREEIQDDDSRMPQLRKWLRLARPEDRGLMGKFLAVISKEKNGSVDDSLTDEQLKYLAVPFLQSFIIDDTVRTPIARLAQLLKSFLDDIANSTTLNDLESKILLDIAVLGSKIMIVKNSLVADLEELMEVFKGFSGNQGKAVGNIHASDSSLRNRMSADPNESPGVPESKPVPGHPRNITALVNEVGMKILFSALSELGTLGVNSSSALSHEPAIAIVADSSSQSSDNSSETDFLSNLMDKLRKSLRSDVDQLGFPGNNSDVAEFVGNPAKRSVKFEGSQINGSVLATYSGRPGVQVAGNSSVPLVESQPVAELLASQTQKRHIDGIVSKNGSVDNPSATGMRSNADEFGFSGNNSNVAESVGNHSKRLAEFKGSPINDSALDTFSEKPAFQIAGNSSIPLGEPHPVAELSVSLTQKRHLDGVVSKNGTVENTSATVSHLPDPSENSNESFPSPKNVSAAERKNA